MYYYFLQIYVIYVQIFFCRTIRLVNMSFYYETNNSSINYYAIVAVVLFTVITL